MDKNIEAESQILIVDDDATLRRAVSRTLERAGHRVSEAATGQEGLRLIAEQRPDLVLLDVVLPDLDGIEVCRRVKADPALEQVFVVLLSGVKTGSAEQAEGLKAGADGYVARPISNRELLARVEAMLRIKRAQDALRQSEATARALLNAPTDVAALIDPDGVILEANETMARLYKRPREELIGQCVWDLFPPEVAARRKPRIAEVFETGRPLRFEDERQGIWLDNVVYPVLDARGRVSKVAIMARDVTERVRAEKRAAHLNAVLRAIRNVNQLIVQEKDRGRLLEGACQNLVETRGFHSAWVALLDEAGALMAAAQAGLEAGFEEFSERLGRGDLPGCVERTLSQEEVWVVEGRAAECADCPLTVSYPARARMATRLEHAQKVYGLLAVSVPVEYAADAEEHSLLREVAGDLAYALHGLAQEETRHQMEESLRESEEKYRLLADNTLDVIWQMDLSLRFTYVNPAVYAMFGYTVDEFVGTFLYDHAEPEPMAQMAAIIAGEMENLAAYTGVVFETHLLHKDGTSVPAEIYGRILVDDDGQPVALQGTTRDITERVQSEARFRRAVLESPFPTMLHAEDGEVVLVNRVWTEITGYTPDEIPTIADWTELAYGERQSLVRADIDRLYGLGERVDEGEYVIATRSGESRVWHFSSSPLGSLPDGRRLVLSVAMDVTERKRMEERVRESEEKYRSIVELAPQGIVTLDLKGVVTSCNTAFERLSGFGRDEIVGKHVSKLPTLRLRDIPKYLGILKSILQGQPPSPIRFEWAHKDGSLRWSEAFVSVMRKGGKVSGMQAIVSDVTERVQAEEERAKLVAQIREQARQMRLVLNTVPEGVLVLDAEYRAIMTNRVADEEISILASLAEGDTIVQLGDRVLEELLTSPPKGLWHEVAAGSRSFEVIARPIENGPEPLGWVLVLRDVTTEREVQQRMQQQERLAAVGQLAAGIAHDFNNIMSVIVLYAQLALRIPDLPTGLDNRLETIARQADHATDLIQQILDFGRRSVLERRPMDLVPFLKEMVKLLERTLPESIAINLTYGTDSYKVNADPTRMQQAIMNLAVNARDAMPDGGELRISLARLRVAREKSAPLPGMAAGEWVRIAVSDTGAGIPPEALPHIFEPFFTTKAPGKGSGLGLAQVYGIVKQHEGELDVISKEGEGATFVLYLPFVEVPKPRRAVAVAGEPVQGRGQCILVVEDNAQTREALVDSLELLGYQSLTAANGREALEILDQRGDEIDLVLSDVVMPQMGGVPMLYAIREQGWTLPVVMLTGHSLRDEMEGLRAKGMTDWLPKPPSLEQLARVIAGALSKGR